MTTRHTLCGVAIVGLLLPLAACESTTEPASPRQDLAAAAKARPTAAFHDHHTVVRRHLDTIDLMLAELRAAGPTTQREHMAQTVAYLNRELRPHISGEESTLYPFADEKAGRRGEPYTASLRYEHAVMDRWIREMEAEAASPLRDVREFARMGDRLVGLIHAHLETEEMVVLPMLDRTATAEEFNRQVMAK